MKCWSEPQRDQSYLLRSAVGAMTDSRLSPYWPYRRIFLHSKCAWRRSYRNEIFWGCEILQAQDTDLVVICFSHFFCHILDISQKRGLFLRKNIFSVIESRKIISVLQDVKQNKFKLVVKGFCKEKSLGKAELSAPRVSARAARTDATANYSASWNTGVLRALKGAVSIFTATRLQSYIALPFPFIHVKRKCKGFK